MILNKINVEHNNISCSKHTFYIIRMPISYSRLVSRSQTLYLTRLTQGVVTTFQVYIIIVFFMTTKVNMLTKSENFKKSKNNKIFCNHMPSQLISFYLLISLEGMSTLIPSQGHQIEPFFLFCFRSRFRSCLLIVFVKPSPPFFSTF